MKLYKLTEIVELIGGEEYCYETNIIPTNYDMYTYQFIFYDTAAYQVAILLLDPK